MMTSPTSHLDLFLSLSHPLTTLFLLLSTLLALGINLTIFYRVYTLACLQMQELENRVCDVEDDAGDLGDRVGCLKKRMRGVREGEGEGEGEKRGVRMLVRRVYIHHNLREEEKEEERGDVRDSAAERSKRIFEAVEPRVYLGRRREPYTARPDDLDEGYVPRRRSVSRPHLLDPLKVPHVHLVPLPHLQPSASQAPIANLDLDLPVLIRENEEIEERYYDDEYPRLRIHPLTGLPDSRGTTPGPLLESEVRRRGAYMYSRPGDAHYTCPEGGMESEGEGEGARQGRVGSAEGEVGVDMVGDAGDEAGAEALYHRHAHPHRGAEEAVDYFPQTQPPYIHGGEPTTRPLQDTATSYPPFSATNRFATSTTRDFNTAPLYATASLRCRQEMLRRESSTEAVHAHGEIFRDGEGSGNRGRGRGDGFF